MPFVGKERALRRLARIPEAVKRDQEQLLRAQAAELVGDMKRRAPKGETHNLERSIKAEEIPGRTLAVRISAGGPETRKPVRKSKKGNSPLYDYALGQEFGTEDMEKNPFFFVSYRQKKKRLKSTRASTARKSIARAVSSS